MPVQVDLTRPDGVEKSRLEIVVDGLRVDHVVLKLFSMFFHFSPFIAIPLYCCMAVAAAAETDFGQTDFGQKQLTDFGQTCFEGGGGLEGWGPEMGGPKLERAPKGWGPEKVRGPKFRAFSSLSRHVSFSLCLRWPGLVGPPDVIRQPDSANVHLRVPAFKNTNKIQRKEPNRHKKNETVREREEKERNFGWSGGRRPGGVKTHNHKQQRQQQQHNKTTTHTPENFAHQNSVQLSICRVLPTLLEEFLSRHQRSTMETANSTSLWMPSKEHDS